MIEVRMEGVETERCRMGDGRMVYVYGNESTSLLRIDLMREGGTAYQSKLLSAGGALKLSSQATEKMTSNELSEFMDYRGAIVDTNIDVYKSTLTVYTLRRYAEELLPIITDMAMRPRFDGDDFRVWQSKKYEDMLSYGQRTSHVARKLFYQTVFGASHPIGLHAEPSDVHALGLDDVKSFHSSRLLTARPDIVLAGQVDDALIAAVEKELCPGVWEERAELEMPEACPTGERRVHRQMDGAVQTSLRIGRLLPLRWDSQDYADMVLLTTVLGGYFGSRLMSNLREDKGYTYGIYARTQIYRGAIVFCIMADVAGGTAEAAVDEVMAELERLSDEPIGAEELELAKNALAGDYMRSVDGVFELAQRLCDMKATHVDEKFTDNLRRTIAEATPERLRELAKRMLATKEMVVCTAGA